MAYSGIAAWSIIIFLIKCKLLKELKLTTIWPPEYTIRKSKRAHHISFRISAKTGLEVIMPDQAVDFSITELLEERRPWIEKNLQQIQHQRLVQPSSDYLPATLPLRSLEETWRVSLIPSSNRPAIILRPQQELALYGDVANIPCCKKLLVNWVRRKAKRHLLASLEEISRRTQLFYKKVSLRGQVTRWGSCSALLTKPPNNAE